MKELSINFELDENFLPKREPLLNITPEDIYKFLTENCNDDALAYAFAGVFDEWVYLDSALNFDAKTQEERQAIKEKIALWHPLEEELCLEILSRATPDISELPIGYYHEVAPFMEKHGFLAKSNIYVKVK